ncbi:hypothetical protein [Bacillus methanolicus]|uniref:YhjD n=1 Tax=Bacillus methanolicus (strain MGA3 / ATCC 53907) TaxID=796606 RepID=I3E7I9_BACMM|nr:hypothetical protein [Bacillus methanolicus]AIE59286.1 hypothetical protein BMMGA3_04230 [Bacillus methanolicus MGA3]EIJ82460.1 hypothetical protein MGA3_04430 [Bacillus methanolicus MGA3]UQD51358.1 hypothetical protein C0971_04515 [Bacillus methanolicus]
MTRIPEEDRNMMEQAIYLPMVLTVLSRDLTIVENSPFKLRKPYIELIEETMKVIQKELAEVKRYMKKNRLKVEQLKRDDAFTMYIFLYKGYEEHHSYFNPRIRNKVQELMEYYLFKRHFFKNENKMEGVDPRQSSTNAERLKP